MAMFVVCKQDSERSEESVQATRKSVVVSAICGAAEGVVSQTRSQVLCEGCRRPFNLLPYPAARTPLEVLFCPVAVPTKIGACLREGRGTRGASDRALPSPALAAADIKRVQVSSPWWRKSQSAPAGRRSKGPKEKKRIYAQQLEAVSLQRCVPDGRACQPARLSKYALSGPSLEAAVQRRARISTKVCLTSRGGCTIDSTKKKRGAIWTCGGESEGGREAW